MTAHIVVPKLAFVRLGVRWARFFRLTVLRRFLCLLRDHLLPCSCQGGGRYRRLAPSFSVSLPADADAVAPSTPPVSAGATDAPLPAISSDDISADFDTVYLKVILLGDCDIGKTSFMVRYVGEDGAEKKGLEMAGLNLMDKVLVVRGARIAFSIWDVAGEAEYLDHIPVACRDAAAILFMFDLTSRCTLNSVLDWYRKAKKWNKTAIPVLIGTKFDDFARLPLEMQWTVANEARAYARAMKASLFFSSATHNINVNKIFKFVAAKLFNLPWRIERNLTIGEPIIDF